MMGDATAIASAEDSREQEGKKQDARLMFALIKAEWERSTERAKESYLAIERLASQSKYRRDCESRGRTVRPYRRHTILPRQPGESWEDYERRARRTYRGLDAASVRSYMDLSEMTADQKAEHKRQQARERKRRQRDKQREGSSLTSEEIAFLDKLTFVE